jgi:hypothetical protein
MKKSARRPIDWHYWVTQGSTVYELGSCRAPFSPSPISRRNGAAIPYAALPKAHVPLTDTLNDANHAIIAALFKIDSKLNIRVRLAAGIQTRGHHSDDSLLSEKEKSLTQKRRASRLPSCRIVGSSLPGIIRLGRPFLRTFEIRRHFTSQA